MVLNSSFRKRLSFWLNSLARGRPIPRRPAFCVVERRQDVLGSPSDWIALASIDRRISDQAVWVHRRTLREFPVARTARRRGLAAMKWVRHVAIAVVCTSLVIAILGPWALYWLALSQIDGRPSHASNSVFTAEEAETLSRRLREAFPVHVERLTPYSYVWAGAHGHTLPGTQLAWLVAKSYNLENLPHRSGWWHPSGAALIIWLTRNWTVDELIAKGLEIDQSSNHPATRSHTGEPQRPRRREGPS